MGFPCGSAGKESTWVQSLGWEDPPAEIKATPPIFWTRDFHGLCSPWGCRDTTEQPSLFIQYSTQPLKKNEIMPFATIRMGLEFHTK